MTKALASLLCLAVAMSTAIARDFKCEKSPEAKWGCFWTKGIVLDSADAGYVIALPQKGRGYILDEMPDSLQRKFVEPSMYVVGDYKFCPFPPRLHEPAGIYNLEWRYYGCVDAYKGVTVIRLAEIDMRRPEAEKELSDRVCSLVDCDRDFRDFRAEEKAR